MRRPRIPTKFGSNPALLLAVPVPGSSRIIPRWSFDTSKGEWFKNPAFDSLKGKGQYYDSKAEAEYRMFLESLERMRLIRDVKTQVRFTLAEPMPGHRGVYYDADFTFEWRSTNADVPLTADSLSWYPKIVDVKGHVTKEARIKLALMAKAGNPVVVVKKTGRGFVTVDLTARKRRKVRR